MQKDQRHNRISDTQKQSFDYQQIAMAHHESAHTIIYLNNFIKVISVNVMTPKMQEGRTNYIIFNQYEDIKDEELRRVMIIFDLQGIYGGLLGEKLYYKDICGSDKFPMHLKSGSSYDTEIASMLIRKHNIAKSGNPTLLLKKQIQQDAIQILIEHWEEVKLIAHSLYRKKRLTFDELKYILTRKHANKDYWKDRFKKIAFIHNEKNANLEEEVKSIIIEDAIYSQ